MLTRQWIDSVTSSIDPGDRLAEAEKQVRLTLDQIDGENSEAADLAFLREELKRIRQALGDGD